MVKNIPVSPYNIFVYNLACCTKTALRLYYRVLIPLCFRPDVRPPVLQCPPLPPPGRAPPPGGHQDHGVGRRQSEDGEQVQDGPV